jgi:sec-independent protein translocase protein TatC
MPQIPHIPQIVSPEVGLMLSALVVSLAFGLIALLRNRRLIGGPIDGDDGDLGAVFEDPALLLPHFVELRTRIVNSLIAIGLAMIIGLTLAQPALLVLARPIGGLERLQAIRVTETLGVFFRVGLTLGIIFASPYVIAQLWIFVASGLKPGERRVFYLLFPFAIALFLSGVAFAYFVMLPVAVPFLATFMGIKTLPTLNEYVKFVTSALLWVGVSFEMPMAAFVLAKVGLVNAGMLARNWRYAVVIIAVAAAIITPTPDPVNMAIVMAPLSVLYLLSILLAALA